MTIFIDLDGTLVEHNYDPQRTDDIILHGTVETLLRWRDDGHRLVLTTARCQIDCERFIARMRHHGIVFSHVVCDITAEPRVLINDRKGTARKAFSVNIDRNRGIGEVLLP